MYRHILIPTDGSELAEHAVTNGLSLAKSVGAKVTVMIVQEPFDLLSVPETRWAQGRAVGPANRGRWEKGGAYEAIIAAASDRDCDLIVMGSHGRGGLSAIV